MKFSPYIYKMKTDMKRYKDMIDYIRLKHGDFVYENWSSGEMIVEPVEDVIETVSVAYMMTPDFWDLEELYEMFGEHVGLSRVEYRRSPEKEVEDVLNSDMMKKWLRKQKLLNLNKLSI